MSVDRGTCILNLHRVIIELYSYSSYSRSQRFTYRCVVVDCFLVWTLRIYCSMCNCLHSVMLRSREAGLVGACFCLLLNKFRGVGHVEILEGFLKIVDV